MNKFMRFSLVAIFVFMFASMANAQDIDKKVIMRVPDEIASKLVGMRVVKEKAYIMASDGNYVVCDLAKEEVSQEKCKNTADIIDFDVVVGKIIFLDCEGKIGGHYFPKWPVGPHNACKIEACAKGVVLYGGANASFIAKNATTTFEIPDMNFVLPIDSGLMWAMKLNKNNRWEANFYDYYGNEKNKIYEFSEYFEPSNLEIGPQGIDGELLVSATEGTCRTLSLIANNKRMFWKINGPEKVCPRDAGFDHNNKLILLEKNENGELILSRWNFIIPEG